MERNQSGRKPIAGILSSVDGERKTELYHSYVSAVERSGGVPLILPYTENEDTLDQFVRICDGFLFSGGGDVDPALYGEPVRAGCGKIQRYRDEMELRIFHKARLAGKPILGICRGIQLINVALGGTLYQDIPSELNTGILHRQTEPKERPSHKIRVRKGTPLYDLIGGEFVAGNSFHHQAIKTLGKGLEIMATAEDGVTEAVFLPGKPYLRAYQWHPERLLDFNQQNRDLFLDWIRACGENG